MPQPQQPLLAEVRQNMERIACIPSTLLPDDSPARAALLVLAGAGYDCYAYASGGEIHGTWCVWLGELAQARADRNGRVPVTEWAEQWRDLVLLAYDAHQREEEVAQ